MYNNKINKNIKIKNKIKWQTYEDGVADGGGRVLFGCVFLGCKKKIAKEIGMKNKKRGVMGVAARFPRGSEKWGLLSLLREGVMERWISVLIE